MSIKQEGVGTVESALEKFGTYASVTYGVSMRPLFKTHRDMVILQKPNKPLEKYDVVLYRIGEKYVLHRIIKLDEERKMCIIRGDNTFKKEYVPKNKIIAVLVSFNRKGKSHTVLDRSYRAYSVFWNAIYPIRYPIHLLRSLLAKIYHKLFKRKV